MKMIITAGWLLLVLLASGGGVGASMLASEEGQRGEGIEVYQYAVRPCIQTTYESLPTTQFLIPFDAYLTLDFVKASIPLLIDDVFELLKQENATFDDHHRTLRQSVYTSFVQACKDDIERKILEQEFQQFNP